MYLETLYTENFRNIQTNEIGFSEGVNVFSGNNGQGKTNLLEAIFFLSSLKSFRRATRKNLVAWEKERFGLRGNVTDEETGERATLEVVCDQGRNRYRVDGQPVGRVEDYLSRLSVLAFHPESLAVLKGGPVFRRMFIDRGLFCEDRGHLLLLKEYNRVLAERRWVLRERRRSLLGLWNEKLVRLGVRLTLARAAYCRRLNAQAERQEAPPGGMGPVEVGYRPSISDGAVADQPAALGASFRDHLERRVEEEERRGACLVGPHRDEFQVLAGGRDLSRFGSQGQQRAALLSLILAQGALAGAAGATRPILIFDDVMSELDAGRMAWMLAVLATLRNQVFVSALGPLSARNHGGATRRYVVRAGAVERVEAA